MPVAARRSFVTLMVLALTVLLPACGSSGGGGGSSRYTTVRDGERAESKPGADNAWSLAVSGEDVTIEVDGRVLSMGGVAKNKRLRYALNPGGLYMTLQIMGQPPLVLRPDSLRIGAKTHPLPHPGRHDVDLSSDEPFAK
jgi:hypothetical protein